MDENTLTPHNDPIADTLRMYAQTGGAVLCSGISESPHVVKMARSDDAVLKTRTYVAFALKAESLPAPRVSATGSGPAAA